MWKKIETLDQNFYRALFTIWDEEDSEYECIELMQGPISSTGKVLNVNSSNYSLMTHWTHWMEPPKFPE